MTIGDPAHQSDEASIRHQVLNRDGIKDAIDNSYEFEERVANAARSFWKEHFEDQDGHHEVEEAFHSTTSFRAIVVC